MQVLTRVTHPEGPAIQPVSRWRVVLSTVLSLGGLGLSIYLTIAHFVGPGILECAGNGVID